MIAGALGTLQAALVVFCYWVLFFSGHAVAATTDTTDFGPAPTSTGTSSRPSIPTALEPDEADILIFTLGSEDSIERWKAVYRLKSAGFAVIPRLRAALKDPSEGIRWMAAMCIYLMGQGASIATPDLLKALGDESPLVRYRASEALARIGQTGSITLSQALTDPNPKVRAQAAITKVRYGSVVDSAVRAGLMEAMILGDVGERQEAAQVLREQKNIPLEELPYLIKALRTDDVSLWWSFAAVIRNLGKDAVPPLLAALADPELRGGAAAALNQICNLPREALEPLMKAREGSEGHERMENTRAIGCLGRYAKRAVGVLIEELDREDYLDRQAAVSALGRIGPIKRSVFPAVLRALLDKEPLVRAVAVGALRGFPKRRRETLDALSHALMDEDPVVRRSAAVTLALLDPPPSEVSSQLLQALSDLDPGVRQAADQALKRFNNPAANAAPKPLPK